MFRGPFIDGSTTSGSENIGSVDGHLTTTDGRVDTTRIRNVRFIQIFIPIFVTINSATLDVALDRVPRLGGIIAGDISCLGGMKPVHYQF